MIVDVGVRACLAVVLVGVVPQQLVAAGAVMTSVVLVTKSLVDAFVVMTGFLIRRWSKQY